MSILRSFARGHGFASVLLVLILTACSPGTAGQGIVPPATPPLSRSAVGYGVVALSYTHVLDQPGEAGVSLGFLRRGAILVVAERRTVSVGDLGERWVRVAGDTPGWVRESVMRIYDNEAQARTAAEALPK